MKLLIYGSGVIGSLYASVFSEYGNAVSVLARGHRLEELRAKGLLRNVNGKAVRYHVTVMDELKAEDRYDYIFLTVRAEQAEEALAALKNNRSTTIVTMINSIEPYEQWEKLCGKGRLIPAFPGAGGSIVDGVLHAELTPAFVQPTTFGELRGSRTEKGRQLEKLFSRAKIPYQRVGDMHAWQICHLALVVPLADAYRMTDRPESVGKDKNIMRKAAIRLRANYRMLVRKGIHLSPWKMNLFRFAPVGLLELILGKVYQSPFGNMFMYQHAIKAKTEMKQLHREFYSFLKAKEPDA